MKSNLIIKRQLLFQGYKAEYHLWGDVEKYDISRISDYLLNALLPSACFSGEPLIDIKGQDIIANGSVAKAQLFSLSGQIPDTLISTSEKICYQDFNVEVTTDFTSFDNQHINFIPTYHGSILLPTYIKPQQLGRVFPLKITEVSLNMEFYYNRFLMNSIALAPIVTQTFSLTCIDNKFQLVIKAEHLKKKGKLPLTQNDLIYKIDQLTENVCNVTVSKDWLSKLK